MVENTTTLVEKLAATRVSATLEEMLNLDSPLWTSAKEYTLEMAATPLANQPSPYIKATRDEKEIGKITSVAFRCIHNGKEICFHLSWKPSTKSLTIGDLNTFPDGVALLFPMKDGIDTPIKEMGTQDAPTNAWYWRADFDNKPKNQVTQGLSTSLYTKDSSIVAKSDFRDGVWRVTIGRAFEAPEDSVKFAVGGKKSIGVSAWEGASGERGGVKAFSKEWRDLQLA